MRLIKPNLIPSHDWHVQPICQRSLKSIRLSGPFWIEGPDSKVGVSSNLMRSPFYPLFSGLRRFCANLLNLLKLRVGVNLEFRSPGQLECCPADALIQKQSPGGVRAAQSSQISSSAKSARTTRVRRRSSPGSNYGLFSAGFPTGVRGAPSAPQSDPTNEPASHFPQRAGHTATGRLYCQQLFKSSTRHHRLQAICGVPACLPLQLSEHTNLGLGTQAKCLWKEADSVGNAPAKHCRRQLSILPSIVWPFTAITF